MASSTASSPVAFPDRDSSPEQDVERYDNDDDNEETQLETYVDEELDEQEEEVEEETQEETQDIFDEEFPAEAGDEEEQQTMTVDEGAQVSGASTAKRKKKDPVALERPPGKSLFPVSRVQKIIKADKDIPIVAKDAVFLISLATEEFIRRIVVAGQRQAKGENRSTVKHQDLASVVRRIDEFMFLEDILPWMAPGPAPKRPSKVKELAHAPALKGAPTMLDQFVSAPNETSGSKRKREGDDVVMGDDSDS